MPVREMRTCEICGSAYRTSYSRQRTCGWDCAGVLRWGKRPPPRAKRAGRQCEVCGVEYTATYPAQRTCGRICGAQINRLVVEARARPKAPPTVHTVTCPVCGVIVEARSNNAKYCSPSCCAQAQLAQRRATKNWGNRPNKNPSPAPCIRCGQGSFPYPRRNCADCADTVHRAQKARQRKQRVKVYGRDSHRKRARKYGVEYVPIKAPKIYERDRWICQLCGKKVNRKVKVPHPKAPTLDHIVPMSDGGGHVPANVQLAHFLCNSLKGTGGMQQLMLVG